MIWCLKFAFTTIQEVEVDIINETELTTHRHYKWNRIDYTLDTAGARKWVCGSVLDDFQYFCIGWQFPIIKCFLKGEDGTSLPVQASWVRSLVREDPTCHGATKPVRHNYRACTLEPTSHNCWACVPQLLKHACLEPVLRNKRSHHNEKPAHRNEE